MTEEDFEREERDEAAMDPNAVIDVKELAHCRQAEPRLPATPLSVEYTVMTCMRFLPACTHHVMAHLSRLAKAAKRSNLQSLLLNGELQVAGSLTV